MWNDEELRILRDYYPQMRAKVLARMLPGRTDGAVRSMATRLKIKRVIIKCPRPRKTNRRVDPGRRSQRCWLAICADLARGEAQ
jgi:hypothetical protein